MWQEWNRLLLKKLSIKRPGWYLGGRPLWNSTGATGVSSDTDATFLYDDSVQRNLSSKSKMWKFRDLMARTSYYGYLLAFIQKGSMLSFASTVWVIRTTLGYPLQTLGPTRHSLGPTLYTVGTTLMPHIVYRAPSTDMWHCTLKKQPKTPYSFMQKSMTDYD